MKNIALIVSLLLCVSACGKTGGGGGAADASKPLTVDELTDLKEKKPDELTSKYNGKNVMVVGKVMKLPNTFPGAYETFGFQDITLEGKSGLVDCQVTEAEGAKFKDAKVGDVVTVTGTLKYEKLTIDLENCTKATAQE
jgi:RecJ-like exonuclease